MEIGLYIQSSNWISKMRNVYPKEYPEISVDIPVDIHVDIHDIQNVSDFWIKSEWISIRYPYGYGYPHGYPHGNHFCFLAFRAEANLSNFCFLAFRAEANLSHSAGGLVLRERHPGSNTNHLGSLSNGQSCIHLSSFLLFDRKLWLAFRLAGPVVTASSIPSVPMDCGLLTG